MAINTWGGKETIDPPMPSNEEKVRKDDDKVVKGSGEVEEHWKRCRSPYEGNSHA